MQTILGPTGMALLNAPAGFQHANRTVYATPGTFTFTPAPTSKLLFIEAIGSGGGATSVTSLASNAQGTTGGNSGVYVNTLVAANTGPYTVVVAAGVSGNNGAQSTVTDNTGNIVCAGGGGRLSSAIGNGTTEAFAVATATPLGTLVGDFNGLQNTALYVHRVSGTLIKTGRGGNSILGGGGVAAIGSTTTAGAGGTGGKYGAGGGGTYSINAGGSSGATTSGSGLVIIWEFLSPVTDPSR